MWTLSDLQCTWRVQADQTGPLWSCVPSNDGRVYSGGEDGTIRVPIYLMSVLPAANLLRVCTGM